MLFYKDHTKDGICGLPWTEREYDVQVSITFNVKIKEFNIHYLDHYHFYGDSNLRRVWFPLPKVNFNKLPFLVNGFRCIVKIFHDVQCKRRKKILLYKFYHFYGKHNFEQSLIESTERYQSGVIGEWLCDVKIHRRG